MTIELEPKTRRQLIRVGNRIGAFIKKNYHGEPWVVCLNGDADSGKSLIAFGIDQALSPGRYPEGVHKKMSPDTYLSPFEYAGLKTIFNNFSFRTPFSDTQFFRTLTWFMKNLAERAKTRKEPWEMMVLVASNFERRAASTPVPECYVDLANRTIAIQVKILPNGFSRLIELSFPPARVSARDLRALSKPLTRKRKPDLKPG